MPRDWLEGHSSWDTNKRIDVLLTYIHAAGDEFLTSPNIISIMKYWSLMKRFYVEVRPAILKYKDKWKNAAVGIKKAYELISMAKIDPKVRFARGVEKRTIDLLMEAHETLYAIEDDLRVTLQFIGFFYRPSGANIPGIKSLRKPTTEGK